MSTGYKRTPRLRLLTTHTPSMCAMPPARRVAVHAPVITHRPVCRQLSTLQLRGCGHLVARVIRARARAHTHTRTHTPARKQARTHARASEHTHTSVRSACVPCQRAAMRVRDCVMTHDGIVGLGFGIYQGLGFSMRGHASCGIFTSVACRAGRRQARRGKMAAEASTRRAARRAAR